MLKVNGNPIWRGGALDDSGSDLFADLYIFSTVAACRSFSGAAAILKVPGSAVSRSIKRLEQRLGITLVNRTTRRSGLTEDGRMLFEETSESLLRLQTAIEGILDHKDTVRGTLRVTSAIAFGRRFVAPLLTSFRKTYPEVEIELSLTDNVVELVGSGFDLAIRGGVSSDGRVISKRVAPVPLYVCASPRFIDRYGFPAEPADLQRYRCIRFKFKDSPAPMAWAFTQHRRSVNINVRGPLCFDDIESVCNAAIADEGFAQLPGYIAVEHIRAKRLQPVLLDFLNEERGFYVTYLNRSSVQPLRSKLFLDYFLSSLSELNQFRLSPAEASSFPA